MRVHQKVILRIVWVYKKQGYPFWILLHLRAFSHLNLTIKYLHKNLNFIWKTILIWKYLKAYFQDLEAVMDNSVHRRKEESISSTLRRRTVYNSKDRLHNLVFPLTTSSSCRNNFYLIISNNNLVVHLNKLNLQSINSNNIWRISSLHHSYLYTRRTWVKI